MKKISIIVLFFLISLLGNAQARIGYSMSDIKAQFPEVIFKQGVTTNSGEKYISMETSWNTLFAYYFNSTTGLSYSCLQIPYSTKTLNMLIEKYNREYVIVSERYWKDYLENGGIIHIKLIYDESNKINEFYYFMKE